MPDTRERNEVDGVAAGAAPIRLACDDFAEIVASSVDALYVELRRNPRTNEEGSPIDVVNSTKGVILAFLTAAACASIRKWGHPYALGTSQELLEVARKRKGGGKKPTETGAIRKLFSEELTHPEIWWVPADGYDVGWSFVTPERTRGHEQFPPELRDGRFGVVVCVRQGALPIEPRVPAVAPSPGQKAKKPTAPEGRISARKRRAAAALGRAVTSAVLDTDAETATALQRAMKKGPLRIVRTGATILLIVGLPLGAAIYSIYRAKFSIFTSMKPKMQQGLTRPSDAPFRVEHVANKYDEGSLEFRRRGPNTLLIYATSRIDRSDRQGTYVTYSWEYTDQKGVSAIKDTPTAELLVVGGVRSVRVETVELRDVAARWQIRNGQVAAFDPTTGKQLTPFANAIQFNDGSVSVTPADLDQATIAIPQAPGVDKLILNVGEAPVDIYRPAALHAGPEVSWVRCFTAPGRDFNGCTDLTLNSVRMASLTSEIELRPGKQIDFHAPETLAGRPIELWSWIVRRDGVQVALTTTRASSFRYTFPTAGRYTCYVVVRGITYQFRSGKYGINWLYPTAAYHTAIVVRP